MSALCLSKSGRLTVLFSALATCTTLALLWIATASTAAGADEETPDLTPLKRWIEFQSTVKNLETRFVQHRKLKTLRRPIRSEGTFWLLEPDQFRWQVDGDPPKMIAIRDKELITVLMPARNRAEQVIAGSGASPALDFLANGFPSTLEEWLGVFTPTRSEVVGDNWEVSFKPTDRKAARSLTRIMFRIDAERFYLKGFELDLGDGSNILTSFTRQVYNGGVDATLFVPDLEGYEVKKK